MKSSWVLPGVVLALVLGLWTVLGPVGASPAYAQCGGGSCGGGGGGGGGCNSCSPPPCNSGCQPPSPPTPPCCNAPPRPNIPGIKIYVSPTVVVNAQANASAVSNAASAAASFSGANGMSAGGFGSVIGPGGSGIGYAGPGPINYLQGLMVDAGRKTQRVAFQNTRTRTVRIVIRAVCMDDKDVPHPASQVIPDKTVDTSYEGELFRCIAGTTIQYTYADYNGSDDFQGGKTTVCRKNDAIWFSPGGSGRAATVSCRPQLPARDCNERSLLRRFGAGVKIVEATLTETYTDYREEAVQAESSSTFTMTLDGGVGGYTY